MEVSFNADLFDEETVAGLADDYVRVLGLLCGDPDQPVSGAYALLGGGARPVRVSIRDEHGVSLPYRVPGEVWLDGTPTGLLGRMEAGGGLDVLGRADAELVVRGCRVPGEVIERALLDEPSIAAAEVSVGDGGELTARLTAVPGGTRRVGPNCAPGSAGGCPASWCPAPSSGTASPPQSPDPEHPGPKRTGPERTWLACNGPGRTQPEHVGPDHAGPGRAGSG